jgi:hypothetical protein
MPSAAARPGVRARYAHSTAAILPASQDSNAVNVRSIYFNPKGGRPGIWGPSVDIDPKEFPADWFEGLPDKMYQARRYDTKTNKYGVKAGQPQAAWCARLATGWLIRNGASRRRLSAARACVHVCLLTAWARLSAVRTVGRWRWGAPLRGLTAGALLSREEKGWIKRELDPRGWFHWCANAPGFVAQDALN